MIPLTRAKIGEREIGAVGKVLRSGWLTMGPETHKFEEEFAKYVGAKYAIAVNSATSALFLSLKALGIGPGDEVIVPSFTFASTASVVIHSGAVPVFVDIKENDFTMDQKSMEGAVSKRTKAVIPVHYGGNIAKVKTDLPIIEDSAHLISKHGNNNKAFSSCYSFYATKNMTTGEGGMITVSGRKRADWLKKARLHGLSRDAWKRYGVKSKWIYTIEFPGWKVNTTDINSALGRVQLKRLDNFQKRRERTVGLYNKLLGLNNKGTHLYPVIVNERDKFFKYMKENGVGCSFHFTPLHLQPAYKNYGAKKLPVTEYIGARVATLPLDAVITSREVKFVAELARPFLSNNKYQIERVDCNIDME